MSNDDTTKYTSLTNYKALAAHLGTTKEAVMAAKERGDLNIMDLQSVVAYVCASKGWFFSTETTAAKAQTQGARTEAEALAKMKPTVRSEVSDNAKTNTPDPYLDRIRQQRGELKR
jgi:hypothetical protein